MMKFEKLNVWKAAIRFSTDIYTLSRSFPRSELYGITSQLRRASQSIALNIAEGSGRTSDKEYARFIDIAIGSALECGSGLHICKNLNFIDSQTFHQYYQRAEKLCMSLYSFKKCLRKSC